MIRPPPNSTLFPYTTLFRSAGFPTTYATRSSTSYTTGRQRRTLPKSASCVGLVWPGASSSIGRSATAKPRSEEHTSELQSQFHLVCRLLLEKKNQTTSEKMN